MTFRLHLFGTCHIRGPSGQICGRAAQPRQLAFLALAGVPVGGMTRDRIAAYLWPDRSAEEARHMVADVLYILRQCLRPEAVRSSGESIYLDRSVLSSDVAEFRTARETEDWERMLNLYEGPFLDGFHGAGGPDFERWAEDERIRCREVATEAVEKLASRCEERGDLAGAVFWLRRGRAVDPLDEEVVRRLMALSARRGNRAGAVQAYRELEQRLSTDLGLAPSDSTRAVLARIWPGALRAKAAPAPR